MKLNSKLIAKIILLILFLVLVVLVGLLFEQYRQIRDSGIISAQKLQFENLVSKKTLTSDDAVYLDPWMTFNYINVSFKLPADYLKNALNISDSSYPNITIYKYAKTIGSTGNIFIENVRNAVKQYFSAQIQK